MKRKTSILETRSGLPYCVAIELFTTSVCCNCKKLVRGFTFFIERGKIKKKRETPWMSVGLVGWFYARIRKNPTGSRNCCAGKNSLRSISL